MFRLCHPRRPILNGLHQARGPFRQSSLVGLRRAFPRMVSTSPKDSSGSHAHSKKREGCNGLSKPDCFLRVWVKRFKLSSPEDIVQHDESYSKWRQVPFSIGVHLSLGSVFAFSVFNTPLSTCMGVVAPAAGDWGVGDILPVFGCTLSFFGFAAAVFGRSGFYERYGPRVCCLLGAISYASGFSIASIAVNIHSLPLLYLGYGVFGGIAMGVAYVPAVAVLLRWFPEDKGFASGLAVMGYGAGGLVATPTCQMLLRKFSSMPTYYGDKENAVTVIENGILYAAEIYDTGDLVATSTQVVYAGAAELATLAPDLSPGYYIVNSGSTGICETFLCLGIGYGLIIATGALNFKLPSQVSLHSETSLKKRNSIECNKQVPNVIEKSNSVMPTEALKTPQFWILWLGVGLNSSAAYSIIASGKTMMMETFGNILPDIVTTTFAGWYVAMISASNLSGRLLFSSLSDKIGRKLTFHILWGSCVPLYLIIPLSIHWLADMGSSIAPLVIFYTSSLLIISCMGATAATFPAYIADLFGSKYVAAIHGQVLSVLIPAGFLGPFVVSSLRERALTTAIQDLASKISPEVFEVAFGKSHSHLPELMKAKVVTINRLMDILPADTMDPTIFIYDETMIVMSIFHVIASGVHFVFMRPVHARHFINASDSKRIQA